MWMKIIIGLLFASCVASFTTKEFQSLVDPDEYDKLKTPASGSSNSTEIQIGLYIISMRLHRARHVMTVVVYLRQAWTDPRLAFSPDLMGDKEENPSTLLPNDAWEYMWIPDTFIRNAVSTTTFSDPKPERLMKLTADGSVWCVVKMAVDVYCPEMAHLNKKKFSCSIQMESFSYTNKNLTMKFWRKPVEVNPEAQLHDHIYEPSSEQCSQNYTLGVFPCLEVKFLFEPEGLSSHFVLAVYICSFLLVVVSWLGFWMIESRVVERLALPLLCTFVLMIAAVGSAVYGAEAVAKQPVDVWLAFCIVLVLATLVEFILVYGLSLFIKPKLARMKGQEEPKVEPSKIRGIVDVVCGLIVFPAIFFIFNIYFWASQGP